MAKLQTKMFGFVGTIMFFCFIYHVESALFSKYRMRSYLKKCEDMTPNCVDIWCDGHDGCMNCEAGYCTVQEYDNPNPLILKRVNHICVEKCPRGMYCEWKDKETKKGGFCRWPMRRRG